MEFSRQEYWSGLPFLLQEIFPTQGLNTVSCIAGRFFTISAIREVHIEVYTHREKERDSEALREGL